MQHPANVLMCPHTCVTNLPKPREAHPDVGPASVIVGNLVQGNRLAAAYGRDIGGLEEESETGRRCGLSTFWLFMFCAS